MSDSETDYYFLVPTLDAAGYLGRVETSGWTDHWPDSAKQDLVERVHECFGATDEVNRMDVFRALATASLLFEKDSICDIGESGGGSYHDLLHELSKASFGEFDPDAIEDAWVSPEKSEKVYSGRRCRAPVSASRWSSLFASARFGSAGYSPAGGLTMRSFPS